MKTIQPDDVNPDPRQAHKNLNDNGNDSGQSNEESSNDECDVDPRIPVPVENAPLAVK